MSFSSKAQRGVAIIVHGFFGVSLHLQPAARALAADGWRPLLFNYKSRSETIHESGKSLAKAIHEASSREGEVRYLTHSMGGVVLRAALSSPELPEAAKTGKAVLLGPPMRGSLMARLLHDMYAVLHNVLSSDCLFVSTIVCSSGVAFFFLFPRAISAYVALLLFCLSRIARYVMGTAAGAQLMQLSSTDFDSLFPPFRHRSTS